MRYWDCVNAARQVIEDHGLTLGKTYGMTKYMGEGVAAMIQQAALDFLSIKFKGFSKEQVRQSLASQTDELYDKWTRFAEKVYGINSNAGQATGWEMIVGGKYGDPGLVDFPQRGALHQSKEELLKRKI